MKSGELSKNLKHTGKRDIAEESKSNTEVKDQQESTIAQFPIDKTESTSESLPDPKLDFKEKPTPDQTSDSKPDVVETPQESLEDKQTETPSKSDSLNKVEGADLTVDPVDRKVEDSNSSSAENVEPDPSTGDNS